jgi:Ca2+-binding EF-hand superfamily protein
MNGATNSIAQVPDGRISPPVGFPDQGDDIEPASLLRLVSPGRLIIKGIRRRGFNFASEKPLALNPTLRFTLGPQSLEPLVRSTRTLDGTDENPSFGNDAIHFDIQDPNAFIHQKDICLKIDLLNKNLLRDHTLAEIEVSVVRFLTAAGKPQKEQFPVRLTGETFVHASITLEFDFFPVKEGLMSISIHEYISPREATFVLSLGNEKETCKIGHGETSMSDVLYMTVDRSNWFQDLKINLSDGASASLIPLLDHICNQYYDDNHTGSSTQVQLVSTANETDAHVASAKLLLKFMQAGELKIHSIRGSLCKNASTLINSGMQMVIKSKGRGSTLSESSSILRYEVRDMDILWNDVLNLSLVDHHILSLELYSHDSLLGTCEELVGSGEMSLLPLYRKGSLLLSVSLLSKNDVGTAVEIGEATFALEFAGHGLAYPKLHPTPSIVGEDSPSAKFTVAQEVVRKGKQHATNSCQIFSDQDIVDSFKVLDQDKNGFIGASELRHALICMGELITDEEIDAMIDILDLNGDGQVNFQAFKMMGKSSNFGFINNPNLPTKETKDSSSTDLDYEVMRKVLSSFVLNNKISRQTINAFRELLGQKRNAKLSEVDGDDTNVEIFHIDHPSLCKYLTVHSTGESQTVFDLTKVLVDDNEYADARSLILGLVNFIPTFSVFERCQMMLELFDDRRLGHVSSEDLKKVLAANHMRNINAVEKKAQTILKFVDRNGKGQLKQDDLLDAATKFPNLLFPRHVSDGK